MLPVFFCRNKRELHQAHPYSVKVCSSFFSFYIPRSDCIKLHTNDLNYGDNVVVVGAVVVRAAIILFLVVIFAAWRNLSLFMSSKAVLANLPLGSRHFCSPFFIKAMTSVWLQYGRGGNSVTLLTRSELTALTVVKQRQCKRSGPAETQTTVQARRRREKTAVFILV